MPATRISTEIGTSPTNNDYDKEVFNGDVGYVRRIDPDSQELVIEFDDKPRWRRLKETSRSTIKAAPLVRKYSSNTGTPPCAVIAPTFSLRHIASPMFPIGDPGLPA